MTSNRPSEAYALYGTEEPPQRFSTLRAGDLTAELVDGNLRYIRFRGHEVLRAIAYVVRDENWGTYTPEITGLNIEEEPGRFTVHYQARCGVLTYEAVISGHSNGHLVFNAVATPDKDFTTNRCGFCVLHPIVGVAGKPAMVEHSDGSRQETVFPDLIESWQPFKDIRALTHDVTQGITATCTFAGDVFEMEDQRNWSDASYKTYVRPLALPWPYVMPAGQPNRQAVDLRITVGNGVEAAPSRDGPVTIEISKVDGARKHPEIGLLVDPDEFAATAAKIDMLQALAPQFLLLHFDPTAGHGEKELQAFAKLQRESQVPATLEYVVACDGDLIEEFSKLAAMVRDTNLDLAALAVCPSVDRQSTPPGSEWPPCPPLGEIYNAARRAFPDMPLGGGMFSYFTELNRKRPPVEILDFVTHGTNPIVHAADDISVMETLEALPDIFRSARAIIGDGKTYRLGLCSIPMRQNPYGTHTMGNPDGRRITMARRDPRQRGLFAAAWMLGYAARVACHDIASVVPAALTGPLGILGQSGPLPIHAVIRELCRLSGKSVASCRSSDETRALALAADEGDGSRTLFLANLTRAAQQVETRDSLGFTPVAASVLHAGNFGATFDNTEEDCTEGRLLLPPYAVARMRLRR
ncbi:hypothetical protein ATN84_21200 [Paramesorhizobium deserti]|uniref:Uncharacterized protein n=1 Tax=Paramesorhizobium deserti TaxID=1494590 RepID=A0A135HPQ1_9HYPH|nr:hypothetical protein [Paramesorhizobium deserti]KXF75185.1 hypothetical protein ATN84_21200 [Paramesorhizobium deserti]